MVSAWVIGLMHRAQDVVEQPLMPPLACTNARSVPAASGARSIDISCAVMRRLTKVIRPEFSVAATASGSSRSAKRARSSLRLRSRSQSAMNEPKSICRSLASTGAAFEEMHLDEFAELVGDAVLVALDDRGVRDRQSERPSKQRDHRVPVGQAADGGRLRKGRDEAERRMHRQHRLGGEEDRKRRRQHRRRQQLHAPQFGGAGGVAGRVGGEGGGKAHDGFRGVRASSCAMRRSRHLGACEASSLGRDCQTRFGRKI